MALKTKFPLLTSLSVLGFLLVLAGPGAHAGEVRKGARVMGADHFDVSRPLAEIAPIRAYLDKRAASEPKPFKPRKSQTGLSGALQSAPGPLVSATSGISFDGVGEPNYSVRYAPPDTNGSVGRTIKGVGYYIQWVNVDFGIFDKATGQMVYGPAAGNTVWAGFGGACEAYNDGDPIVIYDKMADRWVFTQFAVSAQPYTQCVAVSKTSNPLGQYNRYAFTYGNLFNDYPKVGVWPDGYYVSYNMFANAWSWAGGEVCALDRTAMLKGGAATQQCFNLGTSHGGMLTSDADGTILPPAGSPNYVLEFATDSLNMWKFHVDWTNPANTTLSAAISIPVAPFSEACGGGSCVRQAGTHNKLDSLGDRLMYRLAYRRFSDGHEALVVNHSVAVSTSKNDPQTGVRWYELRNLSGTPTLYQQGTYAPDSLYRWMGSVAMDKAGNIGMGYSVSSSAIAPGIRFTGRAASDALGTMGTEFALQNGAGSQSGAPPLHRWGDYSSLSVDPDDDCTFWFTTEYLKTTGSFNWSTWIGSFKLNGCQ